MNLAERAVDVAVEQVVVGEDRVRQALRLADAGDRLAVEVEIRLQRLRPGDQAEVRVSHSPADALDHFAAIESLLRQTQPAHVHLVARRAASDPLPTET
ncbi:MAG: hypothetical protein U0521_19315 [Anaerolineae bacterium]